MGGRGGSGGSRGGARSSKTKLSAFSGSEKQVKWANDLRSKALKSLDDGLSDAKKKVNATAEQWKSFEKNVSTAREIISSEKSASRFIDTFSSVSFNFSTKRAFTDTMAAAIRLNRK